MNISTIVISRNSMPHIKECLESIYNQTLKTKELIVVDGNSTDGTIEFLTQHKNIVYVSQQGKGIANARNIGIKMAKGNFISFLDADDVWHPEALEIRINSLLNDTNILASGGHLVKSNNLQQALPAFTPGGFVFRKDVFNELGYFNENWVYASDHEWFKRFIQGGFVYKLLPQIILTKGIHDTNTSVINKEKYRNEMMQILRTSTSLKNK
jgi:glycosyltransferase involved in cell wall biosynthesis